jgi:predicted Zn-dependent peptidase
MNRRFLLPLALSLIAAAPVEPDAPAVPDASATVDPATVDALGPMPPLGPEVPFTVPSPTTARLSNGASLWVVPSTSLPLVTVIVSVPGGSSLDPVGKPGTAALSDQMMTQGAGALDAGAFAELADRLAIQISVDTDRTSSTIAIEMKRDQLERGLDLLADMILRPAFNGRSLKQEKALEVAILQQDLEEPGALAGRYAMATWFGPGHPYASPTQGTVAGLTAVKKKDAAAYHDQAWNAAGATFTIAGDVQPGEIQTLLEARLGAAWPAGTAATVTLPAPPAHGTEPIALIDRPGSAQTYFYLAFPGIGLGDPATAPVRAGTIALGGSFTSRLNGLLREKRGYTYGANARVVDLPKQGVLRIATQIRTDATAPAMTDILGELEGIRAGVTLEEVAKARGAYRQELVEAMETLGGTASAFAPFHDNGLTPDALAAALGAMSVVDKPAIDPQMSAYDVTRGIIVLVGDRAEIEEPLKAAGYTNVTVVQPL